jgi:hypothetical protein
MPVKWAQVEIRQLCNNDLIERLSYYLWHTVKCEPYSYSSSLTSLLFADGPAATELNETKDDAAEAADEATAEAGIDGIDQI